MTPDTQDRLIRRLQHKIALAAEKITLTEEEGLEDADVVVVSYGITSRVAQRAIEMARAKGLQGRQAAPHHRLALPGFQDPGPGRARRRRSSFPN